MRTFHPGYYVQQDTYKSFQPSLINQAWLIDDMELIQLLGQAERQIGKLDMYSNYIPNIELFISMHVVKEATQSSKIEGTKTNIEEALLERAQLAEERRDDWEEVQNYIKALDHAIQSLHQLPFSSRLIKQTHKILLKGVRGKHKLPGEFRRSQNWIGGASLKDATFVPPIHSSIHECLNDLEKFAHNQEHFFPDLLKIALIHYQFETIHPFLDGNGRVGRLLISLLLVEKQLLKRPILYLSDFFERNRLLYYDNLMQVRTKGNLKQWFKFFLVGIIEMATSGIHTFDAILQLQKEVEEKLQNISSKIQNARTVINYLYQHPVIDPNKVKQITQLSAPSAYKLLAELEEQAIVREVTGGKRNRLYMFTQYIDLFK